MIRLGRSRHLISIAGFIFVLLAGLLVTAFQVAAQVNEKADLTSPTPGSVLPGPSVTFAWNAGIGATEYILWVGTTAAHNQLYSKSLGLSTFASVINLPTNGSSVFVRLFTRFATGLQFTDYTFTAGNYSKAALTSPTPGSVLPGPSTTFSWDTGTGATEYILWVGTSAGRNQLYSKSLGLNQSATVNNLPTNGSPVYLRLFTRIASGLMFTDYTYTAGTYTKAAITDPTPGGLLPGSTATFTWDTGTGATEYILWVGTSAGRNQLYSKSLGLNQSATVRNLPTNGSTVYLRLFTRIASGLMFTDYTFTTGALTQAALTSPDPGSALNGLAATFEWSAGVGATEYLLWVGTAPGQHDLYNGSLGLNLFAFVNNLPGGSAPVFVRLRTRFKSSEQYTDYQFTGAPFCPNVGL